MHQIQIFHNETPTGTYHQVQFAGQLMQETHQKHIFAACDWQQCWITFVG
jgi:aspartate aminotransferase-like enzyme